MGNVSRATLALTLTLAAPLAACDGGDARDERAAAAGKTSASTQQANTFRTCQPGLMGGGYRVRAIRIPCDQVRRILPRMFESAKLITKRERERVYRNDDGWTCLNQGQSGRLGFTLVLCVRGPQAVLYRFA